MTLRLDVAVGLTLLLVANASAQWLRYPDARIPRTADGRPELTAQAPRLPDGRIDLSGVWQSDPGSTVGGVAVGQTAGENPFIRLQTEDGLPLLPAAQAEYEERLRRRASGPSSRCLPHTIVDR